MWGFSCPLDHVLLKSGKELSYFFQRHMLEFFFKRWTFCCSFIITFLVFFLLVVIFYILFNAFFILSIKKHQKEYFGGGGMKIFSLVFFMEPLAYWERRNIMKKMELSFSTVWLPTDTSKKKEEGSFKICFQWESEIVLSIVVTPHTNYFIGTTA